MAAKITYLYNLKDEVALNLTVDQITSTVIYGTAAIEGLYDPSRTYKRGDIVPYIDDEGVIHVYECVVDGATGDPINMTHWKEYSVIGKLNELRNELIVLSATQPANVNTNKAWLHVKMTDTSSLDMGDNLGLIVVNNFVLSTNEPTPFTTDLVWGKITATMN